MYVNTKMDFKCLVFCSQFFIYNKAGQYTLRGNLFLTVVCFLRKRRRSKDTYLVYYLYIFQKRNSLQHDILSTNIIDLKAAGISQ